MKIILASASPRRRELLKMLGREFEVIVSDEDETFEKGLTIEEQSVRLARIKAESVFNKTTGNRIVIGSDTMVIIGDKILEKPKDREDAKRMIKLLQGTNHTVITSICGIVEKNGKKEVMEDYDKTNVYIANMTEEEIEWWLNKNKYMDKAGAYATQEEFGVFVEKLEGSFATVMGFPIHKVYKMIKGYI